MNRFDQPKRPSDSIRSDIDHTRQKMDGTIDALSERLRSRHLLDEVLGYFRSEGNGSAMKGKISEATSATVQAVVETVRSHPLPVLAIGAGLAWLIYEKGKPGRAPVRELYGEESEPEPLSYPTGATPGSPGWGGSDLPGGAEGGGEDEPGRVARAAGQLRERAGEARHRIQEKASEMGERAHYGMQHLGRRTAQAGARVRERTREIAGRTRDQIVHTTEERPLEAGLACLAIGLVAGLLAPTPRRLREEVSPLAEGVREHVREGGHDLLERGKRVVRAASDAARTEAQEQGLTADALKERISPSEGATESGRPKQEATSGGVARPTEAPGE